MRILVFGAGVLGCNLARNLLRAGKDVTLLARGKWAGEIEKNGLRIKDKFSPRVSVSRMPVVTELKPEDRYDVIFVVLRYTQLDSGDAARKSNGEHRLCGQQRARAGAHRVAAGEERAVRLRFLGGAPGAQPCGVRRPEENHRRPARGRAGSGGADRADLRRHEIQGDLRAEHGRLSPLPRGVRAAGGLRVL